MACLFSKVSRRHSKMRSTVSMGMLGTVAVLSSFYLMYAILVTSSRNRLRCDSTYDGMGLGQPIRLGYR